MIIDRDFMFAKELELKASANSTVIDTLADGDAIGQELTFHNVINEDFAGATSLTIKVQSSEDGSTNWTDAVISPAIPAAELVKGADVFSVRVPKGLRRHIRLAYTIAGTGTAGKITSFASKDL